VYAVLQKDKLGLFFHLFYCQDNNTQTSEDFVVLTSYFSHVICKL